MTDRERLLDKIQNLLELGYNNDNENEAENALLLAQKLMVAHQLSESEVKVGTQKSKVVETDMEIGSRRIEWKIVLSNVIAKNFRCKSYWQRGIKSTGSPAKVTFIGEEEDIEVAVKLFSFASEFAFKVVQAYVKKHGLGRSKYTEDMRKAWLFGFCKGLDEKFRAQAQANASEWGLVLVTPDSVVKYYNNLPMRKSRISAPSRDSDSYADGWSEGNRFNEGDFVLA